MSPVLDDFSYPYFSATKGPLVLLKEAVSRVEHTLAKKDLERLQAVLAHLDEQTRWISSRTVAMRDEADRVTLLGVTLRRAGLRSYTDEKGRIFVTSTRKQKKKKPPTSPTPTPDSITAPAPTRDPCQACGCADADIPRAFFWRRSVACVDGAGCLARQDDEDPQVP